MRSNMVLRFRDLISETIQEHHSCIKKFGYVWWAWWNKPDERVPRKELTQFQDTIKAKGYIWIYLADSGTLRLYRAKLVEIDIAEDEEAKECREFEKVPEYYCTSKYRVWLRFSNIQDAFPEEIREWAYDDPADFLYIPEIDLFKDKQISSIHEMITLRHRTIYFIQPYNPELHGTLQPLAKKDNSGGQDALSNEIEKLAVAIITLIEEINQRCHYAPQKAIPPISVPPYPKKMETSLKTPAHDEMTFKDFASSLYNLLKDGHQDVYAGIAIIDQNELLSLAGDLLRHVRLVRCDLHHLRIKDYEKRKLGELYALICGKSVLDDSDSRLKVQLELLRRTKKFLKKEHEFVKSRLAECEPNKLC